MWKRNVGSSNLAALRDWSKISLLMLVSASWPLHLLSTWPISTQISRCLQSPFVGWPIQKLSSISKRMGSLKRMDPSMNLAKYFISLTIHFLQICNIIFNLFVGHSGIGWEEDDGQDRRANSLIPLSGRYKSLLHEKVPGRPSTHWIRNFNI